MAKKYSFIDRIEITDELDKPYNKNTKKIKIKIKIKNK